MSDGRRERLRHADMVDGDVMGSKGMGGKLVVMVDDGCFELALHLLLGGSASADRCLFANYRGRAGLKGVTVLSTRV